MWFERITAWGYPLGMTLGYVAFAVAVEAGPLVKVGVMFALALTLVLWAVSRRLKTQASVDRLIMHGEPARAIDLTSRKKNSFISHYMKAWLQTRLIQARFWQGDFSQAYDMAQDLDLSKVSGRRGVTLQMDRDWLLLLCLVELRRPDDVRDIFEQDIKTLVHSTSAYRLKHRVQLASALVAYCDDDLEPLTEMSKGMLLSPVERGYIQLLIAKQSEADKDTVDKAVASAMSEGGASFVSSDARALSERNVKRAS